MGSKILSTLLYCVFGILLLGNNSCMALKYNQIYAKGSHNSYQRDESLHDQLTYHRVRSLEFDLHVGRNGCHDAGSAVSGDWYVYHACFVDDGTLVRMLSDGLSELKAWHDANPSHEVVTVFMDVEDSFDAGTHSPSSLDTLIYNSLGSALYTPADLLAQSPGSTTLKGAVTGTNSWPDTTTLKGKFIFVLTKNQAGYASTDAAANAGKVFVAYSGATSMPSQTFYVYFNQDGTDSAQSAFSSTIYANNLVSRHWYVLSTDITSTRWSASVANKANFIAHNLVNLHEDPGYCTHDSVTGYPFRAYVGSTTGLWETQSILSMSITSEDIWGSSDNFVFLSTDAGTESWTRTWVTEISTVNSHAPNNWAKGGIFFRETRLANSINFGVLRGADAHILRTQKRSSTGGSTSNTDAPSIAPTGSEQESRDFVKITCTYTKGANTVCTAYGSQSGTSWTQIGSTTTFTGKNLRYSGPGASSHGSPNTNADGSQTKFVFTNLKMNGVLKDSSALTQTNIGTVHGTPLIKDSIF